MFLNPLHKQALLMTSPLTNVHTKGSLVSCQLIGLSSTLSFLFKSPLLSGICTPKRQTHCPSGRPVRDQAWDFPDLFREILMTIFREVSGQFSGRHSGTPNTTNKRVWIFLTVSRTIFRTTFRSVFRSTSGRISRHLPGQFPEGFPDPRANLIKDHRGSWSSHKQRDAVEMRSSPQTKFRNTLLYLQKPTTI